MELSELAYRWAGTHARGHTYTFKHTHTRTHTHIQTHSRVCTRAGLDEGADPMDSSQHLSFYLFVLQQLMWPSTLQAAFPDAAR